MRHFIIGAVVSVAWLVSARAGVQAKEIEFNVRSAQTGKWSDPNTWTAKRVPAAGDYVQIRPGHQVIYDVVSDQAIRALHVAGTLTFARDRSTRLDVELIKVQPGEQASEDGFLCDHCPVDPSWPMPALEIGTQAEPIPAQFTATIRLHYFEGTDKESLPGILVCRGRWDIHGAALDRTWVKLGATAKPGDTQVTVAEAVSGWKVGDRVIITASNNHKKIHTFRGRTIRGSEGRLETEERRITRIDGATLTLDEPLKAEHLGAGEFRSEVANLSRNVVVESANPAGVRGHTMYHRDSGGGISYAEFRHLGKEGLLGKYPIHFHLVGASMRGRGVVGASVWDSHNRWLVIHGTDYLLIRDCVGYQSVGHGFYLEDGTEQYNVLDRNLAVQAFAGTVPPKQALPFDRNEGAGFWWANGRNTLVHNVACEAERYGFFFEITRRDGFVPILPLRLPDGTVQPVDVRTVPFLRFEDNEAHSTRLYGIKFGDSGQGIHGDKQHPFIVRNLKAWQTRYGLRPNVDFFLLDGLKVNHNSYGIYGPSLDMQVFRNLSLTNLSATIIGSRSPRYPAGTSDFPTVTFDHVLLENCDGHMGFSPSRYVGHFRNLTVKNCAPGGILSDSLKQDGKHPHEGTYYFHGYPSQDGITQVAYAKRTEQDAPLAEKFLKSPRLRAAPVKDVAFPTLLEPIDDLPPATLVTSYRQADGKLLVKGVAHDNGEIAAIIVNGREATILSRRAGVVDWAITLDLPRDGLLVARATDQAKNVEERGHELKVK